MWVTDDVISTVSTNDRLQLTLWPNSIRVTVELAVYQLPTIPSIGPIVCENVLTRYRVPEAKATEGKG